jgi:phosphatidate cytidylyltransferase
MVVTRRMAAGGEDNGGASPSAATSEGVSPAPAAARAGAVDGPATAAGDPAGKEKPKGGGGGGGSDFAVRGVVGLLMSAALMAVIYGGHMWVALAVVAMEIGMFREILGMGYESVAAGGRIPLWTTTGWYFFGSLMFLLYGKSMMAHFEDQGAAFMALPFWQYMLRHHTFVSFCLYCAGCVGFVLSLRPGQYAYQFSYFGRALAVLVLVVVQSHFMILNVRMGLVFFLLPAALVIINDSFAYFVGRAVGRHSLTSLSPKKTWEGYIGAGFFTMVAAYFLSGYLISFPDIVCPKHEFVDCFWYCPKMTCELPKAFLLTELELDLLPGVLRTLTFKVIPFQLHAMAIGLFASVIAPFGGFMASGAKRAFGIKDFGHLFPGHGGVTDRVDCQLLMAVFTYVYAINFVRTNFEGSPDVGKIMSFVYELSRNEQLELLKELTTRFGPGVDAAAAASAKAAANAVGA